MLFFEATRVMAQNSLGWAYLFLSLSSDSVSISRPYSVSIVSSKISYIGFSHYTAWSTAAFLLSPELPSSVPQRPLTYRAVHRAKLSIYREIIVLMAIYPTSLPVKSLCPRGPSPRRSYVILSFTTPTNSSTSYDKHCGYIGSLPPIRASLLCLQELLTLPSIFTPQDLALLPSPQIHRLGILTSTCYETSINNSLLLRPAQLLSILTIIFTFQLSSNMSPYLISGIITVTGCITGRTFIY